MGGYVRLGDKRRVIISSTDMDNKLTQKDFIPSDSWEGSAVDVILVAGS